MKEKVLIGAGGFAREIMADMGVKLKLFVDDQYWQEGLFKISELNPDLHTVLIAINDPHARRQMAKKLPDGIDFWSHISKYAILLDPLIHFGVGSIICAGCIITTNVHIGNHVHVNIHSTIGHDSHISDFVSISPGVNISGNVFIDENVYIGSNASIREKIHIDSDIVIGMNGAVIKDLKSKGVYVGIPANKKPNRN